MSVDVERLRRAVRWVERQAKLPVSKRTWHQQVWVLFRKDNPSQFRRNRWKCQTAKCLAGHVVMQEGWRPVKSPLMEGMVEKDGDRRFAATVARELLGLNEWQANYLFRGGNTARQIRAIAESYVGEPL